MEGAVLSGGAPLGPEGAASAEVAVRRAAAPFALEPLRELKSGNNMLFNNRLFKIRFSVVHILTLLLRSLLAYSLS